MPWFKTPGGTVMHVRMQQPRSRYCHCGRRAPLLCDWPMPEKKSGACDKPVCETCARHAGDKDYCPFHRGAPPATQAELDLAGEVAQTEAARILGVKR